MLVVLMALLIIRENGLNIPNVCWYIFGVYSWFRIVGGLMKIAEKKN